MSESALLSRDEVLNAIWEQIEPAVYITRAEWEHGIEGWTIDTAEVGGKLAFAALSKGPEYHFMTFCNAPISRKMIREQIEPLIDQYGFAKTRTPKDDIRQRRFNELIGFYVTGESEFFVDYRIDKLRGAKPCL